MSKKYMDECNEIAHWQTKGHIYHCACRLVWGDGECECELRGKKPPIISQMVLKATGHDD